MKPILGILIFGLICISSHAQQDESEASHYLFPEFNRGVILMKDGTRNDALLNYNALTEEMIFDNNGQKRAIGNNELLRIDTVYINNRKFVALNSKFVELVYHSVWDLFIEHKCKVIETGKPAGYGGTSQTAAATSVSSLYSQGRVVYNLKLPDEFEAQPYSIYLLKKNGALHTFNNMRELKRFYNSKKGAYKKYLKANRVKFEDQESMIHFIEYLESQ